MSDTNTANTSGFTVLIVDDEELIREVTAIMVEENGGTALTATDGIDGIEVFAENQDKIDVIFLDFSMPRLNGYETYLQIKELKPSAKFIMSSGLTITPEVERLKNEGIVLFLNKPFHETEFMRAIKTLIKKP